MTLLGCSSGSQGTNIQTDTTKSLTKTDTTQQGGDDVDFRREFISLYQKPIFIDTSFVDNDKKYEIVFHHFSSMDNGLIVPVKYNFDTNEDFITHNFVSDLIVFTGKDTIFEKHITKAMFKSLLDTLDTPLNKYATLLYPTLDINNDSIQIHYSISIPVTDVGIGVDIKFDKNGSYVIRQ
ncbi:MAG: hypothetical protein J0I84_23710 [Terrimonas sp.]|nr:hypothetical protein [Terrimonas sp.]